MKIKRQSEINLLSYSKSALIIISINIIAFFYLHYSNIDKNTISQLVLTPANILNRNYLCIFVSGFLHKDMMHLGLNMLGVFIFSRIVEKHFGVFRTIFLYMGALFISMSLTVVTHIFFRQNIGIIGASGAVMGLVASAMLVEPFCLTFEMIVPIPVMIKGWLFLFADLKGFLGGKQDGISHLAHLFGFFSIAILAYFLNKKEKAVMHTGLIINILSFFAFLGLKYWMSNGDIFK